MLKINPELMPRFKEAYAHACSIGKRKNFLRAIRYAQWGENTGRFDCALYPDFCDHSFGFSVIQKRDSEGNPCEPRHRICGGIIFHEDAEEWSVHT